MKERLFYGINSDRTSSLSDFSFSYIEDFSSKNYVVLLFVSLTSLANGFQMNIIPNDFRDEFKKYYDLNENQIELFSNIYRFSYIIATFFVFSLVENLHKFKFVNPLTIASIFTILGCFLRIFVNTHINLAYFGQVLCGLATPCIMNTPLKLATFIFKKKQRIFCISFILIFNSLGRLFSLIFSKFFSFEPSEDSFKDMVGDYFRSAFYLSLICIPTLFITLIKPVIVINMSMHNSLKKHNGCCNNLKDILHNPNFIYLVLSFCLVHGLFSAYTGKVFDIVSKYGLNSINNIKIWANIGGIFSSILIAYLIDKIKKVKCALISLIVVSLIYFTVITILISASLKGLEIDTIVFSCLYIIYYMSLSPIYCLCYYLVYEITYPGYSSTSIALMIGSSMLSSIGISYVFDLVENGFIVHFISIGIILIALVLILLMNGNH